MVTMIVQLTWCTKELSKAEHFKSQWCKINLIIRYRSNKQTPKGTVRQPLDITRNTSPKKSSVGLLFHITTVKSL